MALPVVGVPGTLYLLHFARPYRHARHYLGWTKGDVAARVAEHLHGQGSPLVKAARAAGIEVAVVWTRPGVDRHEERRLKRWKHANKDLCPVCRADARDRRAAKGDSR